MGKDMERTDFRSEIGRLQKGIRIAWFTNFLILAMTIESGLIVVLLSSKASNDELVSFIAITSVISMAVSAIITASVARRSGNILMAAADGRMRKVENGVVYDVVREMAVASRVEMPEVWIAENSPVANAYAVSDKNRNRVVITDRLLRIMSREEMQGVIGHELGHIASGDSKAMTTLTALTSTTAIIAGFAVRLTGFGNDGKDDDRNERKGVNPIVLVVYLMAFLFLLIAPFLAKIAESYMSRTREATADMLSVEYTRNPSALANALYKLALEDKTVDRGSERTFLKKAGNVAFYTPSLKGMTFATHPPLKDRIDKLVACGAVVNANPANLTVEQRMAGAHDGMTANAGMSSPASNVNPAHRLPNGSGSPFGNNGTQAQPQVRRRLPSRPNPNGRTQAQPLRTDGTRIFDPNQPVGR